MPVRLRLQSALIRIQALLATLWLALSATLLAFAVTTSISSAEHRFTQYGHALFEHLSDRSRNNQAILEGFAALYTAFGPAELARISDYA